MTLSPHPSEIRPSAPRRSAAKKALLAVQVGAGLACATASFAGGAFLLSRLSEEPAAKVTFTRIENWPEIKNGVPDVLAARPAVPEPLPPELRGSPHPERETVADSSPSPAPEPPAVPGAPASVAVQSAPPAFEPEAVADAPVNAAAAPPAVPLQLAETPAAQPAPLPLPAVPAQTARARSDPPKARTAASNPAPAKARAAERTASASKPKPKPPRQKVAAAQRAPETAPAPAESAAPAPRPEDDSLDVLGLRVPNLLPSRRKIRETIESLGL